MTVKFIHTADLHLGKTFTGLTSSSQKIGASLVSAVTDTLRHIIDLAIEHQVDFVIIAGDIFESEHAPYGLGRHFIHELQRLDEAGIAAYLCAGNHDPLSGWGAKKAALPPNTVLFDSNEPQRIEHVRDGEVIAAIYGQSFQDRIERRDLAAKFVASQKDPVSIGVLHCDLERGEPYAPTSLATLKESGMDYWALGHIHKTSIVRTENPAIVYAGSPQGLNINESSAHGCYVVDIAPYTSPKIEFVDVSEIRWEKFSLDCSLLSSLEEVEIALSEYAQSILDRERKNICARVTLTGKTAVHKHLRDEGVLNDIRDEVWGQCSSGRRWFWFDRIDDATQPVLDEESLRQSGLFTATFLEEVRSIQAEYSQGDLKKQLSEELYKLYGKGADSIVQEAPIEQLIEAAKVRVLDELIGREG